MLQLRSGQMKINQVLVNSGHLVELLAIYLVSGRQPTL
jgi:hypothetical protein